MRSVVVSSARWLAGAAGRAHGHRGLLRPAASHETGHFVAVRALATTALSPDARASPVVEAAFARIVSKMMTQLTHKDVDHSNVEEKIEQTVQYLERRLKMSRITAIRTIALHPMLTAYSTESMERKLNWLVENGVDAEMLAAMVRRHPMILGRSVETLEATKEWFLAQGVAPTKIPFLFTVFPHSVSFSLETLDAKVNYLRDIGLNNDQVRRVLQRFPQFLTGGVDNMAAKVRAAKALGVTDNEFVKMLTVVPEFLSLGTDQVLRKIKLLDSLFGEGKGVSLWVSSPRLVMSNPEQMRRAFQYLHKVVGLPPDRINVNLLMRNVDRVIRPRHEFLLKIQSFEVEGVRWISMPEADFVERYPEYEQFVGFEFKA